MKALKILKELSSLNKKERLPHYRTEISPRITHCLAYWGKSRTLIKRLSGMGTRLTELLTAMISPTCQETLL